AGPFSFVADRAGLRRRRRMGWRDLDGGRARTTREAGLLRQLAADRRARWTAARESGLSPVRAPASGGLSVLGIARALPGQHSARYHRPSHSGTDPRDAVIHSNQGEI